MNRLNFWEVITTIFFGIIFTTVGFNLGEDSSPLWASTLSIILGLSSATIANFIVKFSYQFRGVRAAILRSKNVEGHWLMTTYPSEEGNKEIGSLIEKRAITYIKYDQSSSEFVAIGTRVSNVHTLYTTISEFCHIRITGPRVKYINYFTMKVPSGEDVSGYSYGVFFSPHGKNRRPNRFDAEMTIRGNEVKYSQRAELIKEKQVDDYYRKHGDSWIRHYIVDFDKECGPSPKNEQEYKDQQIRVRGMLDGNYKFDDKST